MAIDKYRLQTFYSILGRIRGFSMLRIFVLGIESKGEGARGVEEVLLANGGVVRWIGLCGGVGGENRVCQGSYE
jgi:hypothetical protein